MSQPEINGLATARTWDGVKGISNACGIAVAPFRMLSTVSCRASTVRMEAAAVRSDGSDTRCAAPRYADTPRFSTTRAVAATVATSVRTEPKLKWHPLIGLEPNDLSVDC